MTHCTQNLGHHVHFETITADLVALKKRHSPILAQAAHSP